MQCVLVLLAGSVTIVRMHPLPPGLSAWDAFPRVEPPEPVKSFRPIQGLLWAVGERAAIGESFCFGQISFAAPESLFGPLAGGNVASDAAIADKSSRFVEYRQPGDRDVSLAAVGRRPRNLEIAEGLVGIPGFTVLAPSLGVRFHERQFPRRLADRWPHESHAWAKLATREPMLRIGLPIHVEGELDESTKALLAFPQLLLGLLALSVVENRAQYGGLAVMLDRATMNFSRKGRAIFTEPPELVANLFHLTFGPAADVLHHKSSVVRMYEVWRAKIVHHLLGRVTKHIRERRVYVSKATAFDKVDSGK